MLLKATVMAVGVFTVLVSANAADAQYRSQPAVTVNFGNVGIGYRDGYMGNDHSWHRWEHPNDFASYRGNHRGQYHDWNHDRRR
jgi:hypothetical protein